MCCCFIAAAPKAGTVIVSIFTDGTYIGEAEFEYFDPMEEMIKLLVQNPKYLDVWAVQQLTKEHQWVNVTDVLRCKWYSCPFVTESRK